MQQINEARPRYGGGGGAKKPASSNNNKLLTCLRSLRHRRFEHTLHAYINQYLPIRKHPYSCTLCKTSSSSEPHATASPSHTRRFHSSFFILQPSRTTHRPKDKKKKRKNAKLTAPTSRKKNIGKCRPRDQQRTVQRTIRDFSLQKECRHVEQAGGGRNWLTQHKREYVRVKPKREVLTYFATPTNNYQLPPPETHKTAVCVSAVSENVILYSTAKTENHASTDMIHNKPLLDFCWSCLLRIPPFINFFSFCFFIQHQNHH